MSHKSYLDVYVCIVALNKQRILAGDGRDRTWDNESVTPGPPWRTNMINFYIIGNHSRWLYKVLFFFI